MHQRFINQHSTTEIYKGLRDDRTAIYKIVNWTEWKVSIGH